jgi:hypothetical protein
MKRHILPVLATTLVLAAPGNLRAQVHPTVGTDHADYSPGSKVTIAGMGFRPGERVRLLILQRDLWENAGPEHQPWHVRADSTGAIHATWPVTAHEAGATLWLAAKGLVSGGSAQTVFTDASVVPASGGSAIPADTYTGAYTALTGPALTETIVGDVNIGTIVLTTPAGFVFDTNVPLPFITLSGDNNNKNINNLPNGAVIALAITTNTLSFTVTSKSHGQTKNTLTYSNIRVRPTAASPLASGNLTNTGTSTFPNSTANFGTLTEVAGASTTLAVSGFPSPQVAGKIGSVTVAAQDQFGNTVAGYTGTVHFTSSDLQAVLPADYTFVSGDSGTHTFSGGVTLRTIGTQSITASNMTAGSFSGTQTGIVVSPAAADHLAFTVQPGSGVYGSLPSPQPTVVSQDVFGNKSTVGIGASKVVTVALTSGSGALVGTTSVDIGTSAGDGTGSFTNLTVNAAGAGKQLTASAAGMTNVISSNFTMAQATVTANVTVNNKVYDGTTAAAVATRSLTGVLGSDNVTLVGGTAAFATKTAGNGKSVTVAGLGLGGTAAANYILTSTSVTATANIAPAALAITGVVANNKVYDGTTAATLTGTPSLVGVLNGDSVTVSGTPSAIFANKLVANSKPVTVTGYATSGPDSGNYSLAQPVGLTANITAAALTVSGITAANKVYDGNNTATLNTGNAALVGVLANDVVTLSTAGATGTFATKTIGTGKTVTVSGLTAGGADSANYTLSLPTTTADIAAAGLTVSGITAANKVYDGNNTATLNTASAALVGVLANDVVTLSTGGATGAFATKTIGTGKTVTVSGLIVSGADSANYTLAQPTTTANITAAGLTVSGVTANNKVYDGNNTATLNTGNAALVGVLANDVVTLSTGGATGAFATKTIGTGKPVNINGLTVGGTDAANYTLTQPSTSANISPVALMVTALAADKVYDGTTAASVTLSDNRVAGDSLSESYTTAAFTDKNTGNGKTINVSGISITGPDATNYNANATATAFAAITPAILTCTAADQARLYGQANPAFTVNYTGFVTGDNTSILTGALTVSTSANTNSPVGTYAITASGRSAPNYTVQYVDGALTVAPAHLCAAAHDATRLYGHPNPAFTAAIGGFVNGENTNVLGGTLSLNTTAQTNSPPGSYPIVPSGLLSTNYAITYSNGTLAVTSTNQAPLLAGITNATVRPDDLLMFQVTASDPDSDSLTFSLDTGAPAGTIVTNLVTRITHPGGSSTFVTNTVFLWVPTRAQASSTNMITLRVTDNGGPPMSAAQTFTVVVLDYLEIALGSTNVQSGDSVAVPISLASSDGVTNLDFTIVWPNDYLSNAALVVTAPQVGAASLQDQGGKLVLSLHAVPGQVLQATQQLALLTFEAISNQFSAFVPLPLSNANAAKPDGTHYVNYLTPVARVAVIEGEPLLLASLSTNLSRELTLYGRLGRNYELQSSTSLASPIVWKPQWDYVQTNGAITISVGSAPPMIFYRIFQP